jgi:NIPSNAP
MTFEVIELRRYTIRPGEREHFAEYFDAYFPEAFQQLGAIAFGQFFEEDEPSRFTWLRGFRDMDARAVVNSAFYYGPVWKEHKPTVNPLMLDSDNVLLLRSLRPIPVLPAVDPVREAAPRGAVGMHIFRQADGLVEEVEYAYRKYECAGLLVTLDAPNNFPQLPVRMDGPWVVWLGLFEDARDFEPIDGGEVVVLTPTRRSRLRYGAS